MIKQLQSEKGVTLVEVLSIIVISTIVTGLMYNIMTSGMDFSYKESSKAVMQQQSNYILTLWREYHEAGKPYEVILSDDLKLITFVQYEHINKEKVIKSDLVQDPRFTYNINILNGHLNVIDPYKNKVINIRIEIVNMGTGTPSYRMETKLSRL